MAWLGFSLQIFPTTLCRGVIREREMSYLEPMAELHQTGTYEGRFTDWATAPRHLVNRYKVEQTDTEQMSFGQESWRVSVPLRRWVTYDLCQISMRSSRSLESKPEKDEKGGEGDIESRDGDVTFISFPLKREKWEGGERCLLLWHPLQLWLQGALGC